MSEVQGLVTHLAGCQACMSDVERLKFRKQLASGLLRGRIDFNVSVPRPCIEGQILAKAAGVELRG